MEMATQYSVGSKIAHPVHGAGVIKGIEERSIGEVSHTYYVIETHNMELMIPVGHADEMGLRPIRTLPRLHRLLTYLTGIPDDDEVIGDYKVRHAAVGETIKSGSLDKVAQAIRVLYYMGTQRKLGVIDTRLYEAGMNLLASELALASGQEVDRAKAEIEQSLELMVPEEEEE